MTNEAATNRAAPDLAELVRDAVSAALASQAMPRILRYEDLTAAGFGSRYTVWRMVNRGEFPAPRDLGAGKVGWPLEEIREYLATRPRIRA